MRLLYLTDRLSDRGGADHHLAQVVSTMADSGHRVTVGFGRVEGRSMLPEGVECRRCRGLSAKVDTSARLGELDGLLENADLVHVQNVMNPTALKRAVARGRTVVTVQDHRFFCPAGGKTLPDGSTCTTAMADEVCRCCIADDAYRRSTLELTRRRLLALRSATTVVLSRYMADELAEAGLPGARILPPWVEVGVQRRGAGSIFALGGRLVPHKGVRDGWQAWRAAGRPLPLEVAGTGPLGGQLLGATVHGWLDPGGLRALLRRARALLFPSRWQEPLGILGLEALAVGTPVIVAESGGTGEWSGVGCLRVSPGDVAGMAAAVGRLAADPKLARRLGRAGRQAVADRFGRKRLEAKVRRLYREIAG